MATREKKKSISIGQSPRTKTIRSRRLTAARLAREGAGLSLEQAAKKANCSVAYLRRIELHGHVSWIMAMRLAHLYGCSCQIFLYG